MKHYVNKHIFFHFFFRLFDLKSVQINFTYITCSSINVMYKSVLLSNTLV